MSTATVHHDAFRATLPAGAILRRFVWKEYRLLRGLWLAVAIGALLVEWALGALLPPQSDIAALYFGTALAAAALYAVGAAATTFAVEHEESTYNFLTSLPTTWWPVFVGKLGFVALSSALLAAVLAIIGSTICGFRLPNADNVPFLFSLLGVAIVEAIAWGTLFSLLTRRPLTAAVLALVVGAAATHLAVNISSSNIASSPAAYIDAVPLRLVIAAVVLAASAAVARRWLKVGGRRGSGLRGIGTTARLARFASPARWFDSSKAPGDRRRMIVRLMWQSWRESWKLLPVPIIAAVALFVATALIFAFASGSQATGYEGLSFLTAFVAPALYGALAFSADQRRDGRRFLAEHAARPRYVWLARQIVWLGTVAVLTFALALLVAGVLIVAFRMRTAQVFHNYLYDSRWLYPSGREVAFDLERAAGIIGQVCGLAGWGILAAYGIGQFCSMLMRSEIMSTFLAAVLSIVLAIWVAVMYFWQLAGWMFLLPWFAGFMLATWLRAPAWIADRRGWRSWMLPAVALAAPLVLIGGLLPVVRLAQLPTHARLPRIDNLRTTDVKWSIANQLDWFHQGDSPEARETAAMYLKAANMLQSWDGNNSLARWGKPEYMADIGGQIAGGGDIDTLVTGIDITKIPADERAAFREAARKSMAERTKRTEAAIELATTASQRPNCRFDFNVGQAAPFNNSWDRLLNLNALPTYTQISALWAEVAQPLTDSVSLDRVFTGLRMSAHIRSGQPSAIFVDGLKREQQLLDQVGAWASNETRTNDELREAIRQLNDFFGSAPLIPDEALMADHLLVRDVLLGNTAALSLTPGQNAREAHLAHLASELSWEHKRGLKALDLITLQRMDNLSDLIVFLAHTLPRDERDVRMRRWLQPVAIGTGWPTLWLLEQPAAATSYFTLFEYLARTRPYDLSRAACDAEVIRRATLLRIALAMYHHDHDKYPGSLGELVPDYLEREPLDPYVSQPFQFKPAGVDLVVRRNYNFSPSLGGDIPAGTPFFWSVGSGNVRLKRVEESHNVGPEGAPATELRESVYRLDSDDMPWWNDPVFVFPLAQ